MTKRDKKSRDVTSARQLEADVFARLSKREAHADIAEALKVSREHVTRIAAKFREQLIEAAEATKAAAVDAVMDARQLARDAAPEAVRCLVTEMREADASADRRAAAIALLDRAGVTAKQDVALKVDLLTPETAAMIAVVVKAGGGE